MHKATPFPANPAGLYLHIPFCRTKCPYCHFYSISDFSSLNDFIKAILNEMSLYSRINWHFDTIYLGGGSPSLLSPTDLEAILATARRLFTITPDAEITVEINPGDVDREWLKAARSLGVNRLLIGIQSFQERELVFLGRRHGCAEAIAAIENAYQAGFVNVGVDLIYGIPGGGLGAWLDTLGQAVSFSPQHVSCYELTVEADTPLASSYRQGRFSLPDEDQSWLFFMETSAFLTSRGYTHYEVSNFARDGCRSRHNTKYWNHSPYLGLGPSAHSFFPAAPGTPARRRWNTSDVTGYMESLKRETAPPGEEETLTEEQLAFEALFLGLRTTKGLDLAPFGAYRGTPTGEKLTHLLEKLVHEGLVTLDEGRLRPTISGLALADRLALCLHHFTTGA
ncbi:MAG: radical SAM family heme chaperone HemW [Syntrophales bacterium]|nr:radical SAM family heme chaperone HemW [Syntrophales bacterium]